MNVYSFFSGGGGLDRGLELAGINIVSQCEYEPKCRAILKRHWPDVPCAEDIRSVRVKPTPGGSANGRSALTSTRGRIDPDALPSGIDGICGGVPCQDVSVAGNRAGLAGERTGLFFDFARIADDAVRDGGWLIFENVPGLFSSNGGRDFAVILATLAEIGFHDLAWRTLNSRYFGVPQNRERVFLIARRSRGDSARKVLLEPEGGGGDFDAIRKTKPRVAATLTSGSHGPGTNAPGRRQEDDVNIVTSTIAGGGKRGYRVSAEDAAGNQLVVKCLTTSGQRLDADTEDFVVSDRVRRLTPTERERLQGFPDGWTILPETLEKYPDTPNPPPDAHRGFITGNAVTVPVAKWIGQRIMQEVAA